MLTSLFRKWFVYMYILFGEHPKRTMLATGSLCLTTANDYCEDRRVEDYDVG